MTTTMNTPTTNAAEGMTDTTIFRITHTIPAVADESAKRSRDEFLAQLAREEDVAKNPLFSRGNKYKIVAGRKYPHGLVGVLFWVGHNTYGVSVGLSTSSRKLPNGRGADVIFTTPGNLEFIPNAATAQTLAQIELRRLNADSVYAKKFQEVIADMIVYLARELGMDAEVLRGNMDGMIYACIPTGTDSMHPDADEIALMKKYSAAIVALGAMA